MNIIQHTSSPTVGIAFMCVGSVSQQNKFIRISFKLLARKFEKFHSKEKHNEMETNCICYLSFHVTDKIFTVLPVVLF